MPPAEWPKVTLGGFVYEVRFGMQATYELSKAGTDPKDAMKVLSEPENPSNIAHILDIWRAATAHHFTLAKPKRAIPTVEEWIEILEKEPGDDLDKIKEISAAVGTALFKWLLERNARRNAANPATQNPAATEQTAGPIN